MPNDSDLFQRLLGGDIFFNKDSSTPGQFHERPKAINHVEQCECNVCLEHKYTEDNKKLLRELGIL